jgi:SulP family sulfate permease
MIDWLARTARRVALLEYLTILLIFGMIVFTGFAWGVIVGVLAAALLFAAQYSRVDSVRHMLSGRDYQSSFEQSESRREALRRHGDALLIIRLHGFLFFGTADRLRRRIQARLARVPVRYLFLDFQRVAGLDSATVLSFIRLGQLAERERFVIYLTGAGGKVRETLARGGLVHGETGAMRFADHLDSVLEQCETGLLAEVERDALHQGPRSIVERLGALVPFPGVVREMVACFTRIDIPNGGTLVEEGSPSTDIFIIEAGRAVVTIAGSGGRPIRLAALGPGALVGELSFYLDKPRTASVVAETDITAWQITHASLDEMEARMPGLAAHFHKALAALLADRLSATNRLVRFLDD